MEHIVKVFINSKYHELAAGEGENLLKLLKKNDIDMYTPCNGKGTCGKCKVRISKDNSEELSKSEKKHLEENEIKEGYRLACQISVRNNMEVYPDGTDFQMKIVTQGKQKKHELSPLISKKNILLPPPNLEDQRPDSDRLADFLGIDRDKMPLFLSRQLPYALRKDNYNITLIYNEEELIGIEPGDTTDKLYGMGVDIGTTTIAAYLYDLLTGEQLSVYSIVNPQKKFGADVISSIKHTMEKDSGLHEMHASIVAGINQAAGSLTKNSGLSPSDVYEITLVGNTTMSHFLLNLSAANIGQAPFIPAATQAFIINASDIGIHLNKNAIAVAVPSVAAYIGADTVSAVLSSGMHAGKDISLLVDIGTNGEIVLGNNQWLLSCSAAAGPAFEGANIKFGTAGINGAIDSVKIDKTLSFTTIGGESPKGICGTGLVDIISELVRVNIIDETGRLETDPDELDGLDDDLTGRLDKIDGMSSFIIAQEGNKNGQGGIYITQKDIRELQNAKAAIAAGIKVLIKRAGISSDDISKVYLAGGFGTFMNPESALNIGLIPSGLSGRIQSIGNAAGTGAIEMLLSKSSLKKAGEIREKINYIELSSCKEFNDLFVDSMMFDEE